MDADGWRLALLAATALHLGFQLTITLVAYPALLAGPEETWTAAHAAHGRRITPLVGLVYGALLVTLVGALVTDLSPGTLVAAGGTAVGVLATAAVAAPTHGRLGSGRTHDLVRRLRATDVVRTAGAVVALVGALVGAG